MRRSLLLLLLSSLLLLPLIITQPTAASPAPMMQYTKTWGGSEFDAGQGIAVDSSGNIYITGSTDSFGPGHPLQVTLLLLKYNSSGILQWQRTWSGSGNGSERGTGVAVDTSGNIYVTGSTNSFHIGYDDALLLKFNSSGSLLWQRLWGGASDNFASGVAVDTSGNVYVTGGTQSFGAGGYDLFLLKFNATGSLSWQMTWGGSSDDSGASVAVDSLDNIYVTGSTSSLGAGSTDVLLLKLNSTGSLLWQETWGGIDMDFGQSVAVDAADNIYVTGFTLSFGAGGADVIILKFDPTSTLLWQRTWGGDSLDAGGGVGVDSFGNVYVAGDSFSFNARNKSDVLLLTLSSTGSLLNQGIYGRGGNDAGFGVAVDSAGDAFITGYVDEAPPYNSTSIGNSTLGTPTYSLGNPAFTLRTPTFQARSPEGTVATPSGNQTYTGTYDVFLTLYIPGTDDAPLPASLITLAGLLTIMPVILSRRRSPRVSL